MNRYQKLKSLLLLLFVAVTAKAQLEDGKVYNFVNIGNNSKSLVALSQSDLSIAPTDQTAAEQLWYAEKISDGVFALRNLYSGYYLHSPNKQGNTKWTLVNRMDESSRFTCTAAGGGYALRATNTTDSGFYMHYGAGTDRIVCWDANSGTTASHWTITAVTKTATIQELINNFPNPDAYQEHLNTLFADKACTSLNDTYKSMSVETLKTQEAYVGLPEALQQMVLKVRNGDNSWGEENLGGKPAWDAEYAKKYRVQLYEPYNEPNCASTALSLNWHTNLNNPTGIFANEQEMLYIMVEGEIREGASLYLASYTGNGRPGSYNDGIELREGVNIVTSYGNGTNYCINYVVETFDTSDGKRGHKAKAHPLSQYPALKIHIEGGHINGYYNKMGDELYTADKNDNWDYLEARATQTTITILGKYMTLQFPLNDADTEGNKGLGYYLNDRVKVEDVINSWDNVMMWERLLLGVLDETTTTDQTKNVKSPYSDSDHVFEYTGNDLDFPAGYGDYYNVHGLALGVGGSTYMYGSGDHSGYHYNTMGGIIQNMPTNAGSHWGPAHEIGHQHQNLINMRGETEVSNNLFSNMVLWFYGETTSRVNGTEGSLENVLKNFNSENGHYLNNSIWGMTHMYYKLFLYYHVLGHNPKFYPRLFEMLRQDPQVDNRAGTVDGSKAQLHLYKKACLAAGEDLTEFFRAHGFFKPLDGYVMGDYGNSTYYMTKDQIDAAIAEVKAWAEDNDWKQNIAVLFINDATGETIKSHKGGNLEKYGETTICAEVGGYASFDENATDANYTCNMSGNTLTMEGDGGVGFAIFNEKGELIAFSNKKTFEISSECAAAIMSGTATISAMNADNEVVEIEYDDVEAMSALLGGLLDEVSEILVLSDSDNSHPGFYKVSALAALKQAYDDATRVFEERISNSYATVYEVLNREYNAVKALTTDKTPFLPGSTYVLSNKRHSGKSMTINATDTLYCADTNLEDAKQQWIFEAATEEDTYYLKNVSNKKYLRTLSKSGKTDALAASTADAFPYKLFDLGYGLWALQCQNDIAEKVSLHCDGSKNVVGWWHTNSDNDGSWWYLTATSKDESVLPLYNLQELIGKTEALIDEVGEVETIKLQATDPDANYYLYCNALFKALDNADTSPNTEKLLDGDPATHIHTDYRTNNEYVADDGYDHYLRVDMGSENTITDFKFTYTTRNAGGTSSHPKKIVIEGCNNLNTEAFTHIITLPRENDEPLPGANTNNDGRGVYVSPMIENPTPYRYIRFMVTETQGNNVKSYGDHPYFYMAEFNLLVNGEVKVDNEYAVEITVDELTEVVESLSSAQEIVRNADAEQYGAAYTNLLEHYERLLADKNSAETASLGDLKNELLTLMGKTTTLINSCGTVTYTPEKFYDKAPLQTTNSEGDFYVWTNAQSTQEVKDYEPLRGYLVNLFDGNNETYFHSDYSGANSSDKLDHHITIKLGENNKTSKFKFKYITRHDAEANYPKTIKIQGSVDGTNFDDIETITGLPTGNTKTYESGYIEANEYYSYLRFMVTANNNNNLQGGHPIFHMAEFELAIEGLPESYTAELKPEHGDADTDLLIETFKKNAEAKAVYDYASTELQVEAAIAKLQAQYDILKTAKDAVQYVDFTINANVSGGGVTFNEVEHTETLRAPSTLTAGDLAAMPVDGYVAKSITVNGTTIFVIYNKVYTVKVTGGNGNGGVAYGEGDYMHNDTIQVLGALDVNQLEKIVPEGYELKEEITIDNETGYIHVVFSAIPLVDTDKYYTFECISEYAHSTERFIRDNVTVINGRSAEASLFQFEKADDDNGYYIKSYVTDKYLNHANGAVYASSERLTIWKMEKPSHTPDARTLTVGNNLYLNNNDTDCTDNSCTNLQSKEHSSGVNSDNACSLWTITEGTPLDMTDLKNLIDETNGLIASCYQNGNVDGELLYINSAHVTADLMATTKDAVSVAEERYNSKATVESEYTAAINVLTEAKNNLTTAISNAIAEAEERNAERALLNGLINATKELITLCGTTPGDATQALIDEVSAAVTSAQTIADNVENTKDELTEAKEALQAKYDVLYAAQQSTAKVDLRALIAQTEALIAQCGTYNYGVHDVSTSIALQSTDSDADYWISSNADQNTGGGDNDGGGIAALVDNDTGTYFHTRWGGTEVNEPHYIQVDMGEDVINKFKFSYIARNNSPAPTIIEIYGWNEDEEPTLITTVTKDWPDYNDNGTYDSEFIAPTKAYRYLRFTITKSNGPGNEQYGGQYFFGMKEFDLFSVAEETSYYVESIISYGNITEEQLINVVSAKDAAEVLANNSYDKAALEAQIASLQVVYEILYAAHNDYSYLPVTLTTDMKSPVLYTLGSKRGDTQVLQYDPAANHMLSIADASENSRAKQLFYFTKGSVKGQVFIHPFAAGEQVLASNDVSDGPAKVKVMPKDSEGYMREWTLPVQDASNGVYNIKPITGDTYFSHHGGGAAKMGFYNNTGDPGSRFTFTEATIDGSSAYHSLKVYYDEVTVKDFTNSNPGNYRKSPEIEAACNDAEELLKVPSGDYATYLEAYRDLRAANESLEIIVPEGGKFYTIKNGDYYITGNTTSGGRIELSTANDANTIYYYDGTHLLSYSTGLYIGLNANDWTFEAVGSNDISMVEFSVSTTTSGAFNINCGTRWLHRTDAYVNRCAENNVHGTEHSWIIEEVTELPVSVNADLGFASFYAPVALRMPKGMTAYVVTGVKGDKAPIAVLAKEGEVIPANTGVLLHAGDSIYNLSIANSDEAETVEGENLLHGTIDDQYIEYDNNTHYMLGYKSGRAGLYVVAKNLTSTGGKDDVNGTHFKNNGFKSYLTVQDKLEVNALRFFVETTEIDEMEAAGNGQQEAYIYDLQGRRVLNPTNGMYIVNGKKVVIK